MSFQNLDVLSFYKELPFNIYGDDNNMLISIKNRDPFKTYPVLESLFDWQKKKHILDVGCGGGWFINSLRHKFKNLNCIGIDFNSKAIQYAKNINSKLNLNNNFITTDLFKFNTDQKFDLISSIGVLHHTNNVKEAIKKISNFGSKNSYLFIGLYHKYGRKPFLDYFKNLSHKGEEYMFQEYKAMHKTIVYDETHMYSWFRDQVLHPYETQHTFEEINNLFEEIGYSLYSTSINKFNTSRNIKDIIAQEKNYEIIAKDKIRNKEYFPGFFIIIGKKND